MKKSRVLLFVMLMALSMVVLVSCGKVNPPTVEDCQKALVKEGFIDESEIEEDNKKDDKNKDKDKDDEDDDDEDEDDEDSKKDDKDDDKGPKKSVEITINDNKVNDDQDKATVKCTLKKINGPVETSTDFKIVFKIKDDGKSWKYKSVEKDYDTEKTVLATAIDEDTAKNLIGNYSIRIDEDIVKTYLSGDNITSIKATEKPEIDDEKLQCTGKYAIEGEARLCKVSFVAEVKFTYTVYGNYWYIDDIKYSDFEGEFLDSYKNGPKVADLNKLIADETSTIYLFGGSYSSDDYKVTDAKLGAVELTGDTYVEFPITYSVAILDTIKVDYECNATFQYDNEKSEWTLSYISYGRTIKSILPGFAATWTGTDDEDLVKIVIADKSEVNDDGDVYVPVDVYVKSADNGNYQYKAMINNYDLHDGDVSISFLEWVTLPADENEGAYESYAGVIKDGTWAGRYSWNHYEFTNGSAPSTDAPDTDAPETEEDTEATDAPETEEAEETAEEE